MNILNAREAWLKERANYIGGSTVAAIAGLNPYKTALRVFLEMRGEVEDKAGIYAAMGTALEPLIADLFAKETGLIVTPAPQHIRHHEYDFLGANPDRYVFESTPENPRARRGILECKSYDWSTAHDYGQAGTDQVPRSHFCQAQWYLGITGEEVCYLAALHRTTGRFTVYIINFDPDLYDLLVQAAVDFKANHLDIGIAPDVQGGDLDYIKDKFPTDTGGVMIADTALDNLAERMRDLKKEIIPLEAEYNTCKARFIDEIGENSLCETMVGQFTYRKSKDSFGVQWEQVARSLAAMLPMTDDLREKTLTELAQENTRMTKRGGRKFIAPFSKDKE